MASRSASALLSLVYSSEGEVLIPTCACNTAILISCVARATAWFDPEMEIFVRAFSSMVGLKLISALEVLHMSFTLLPDDPLRAEMAKVGTHIVDVVLMVPVFI